MASPVIVFVLLFFGRTLVPRVYLDLAALIFILLGLTLGIVALFSIRKFGKTGILTPALIGILGSGLLLFIFVTNFLAAKEKAVRQNLQFTGTDDGKTLAPSTTKTFQDDACIFSYDERYQMSRSTTTGQIFLKHPASSVVISNHREKLDAEQTVEKIAAAVEDDLKQQGHTSIVRSPLQTVQIKNLSAYKIRVSYTRPVELRVNADLYVVSSSKSTFSFMHYWPEKQEAVAVPLFESFIGSFAESNGTNQSAVQLKPQGAAP